MNKQNRIAWQVILLGLSLIFAAGVYAQQIADPEFKVHVEKPTYTKNYPRVLFDEAHNNFHTTEGRYKPFADLIGNDGFHVVRNRNPFSKTSLSTFKLLVIANAMGAEDDEEDGADKSAFTQEEIQAVYDWVRGGGALLLIADHAPFGGAAEALAKKFDVEMSKGFVIDAEHAQENAPSILTFSRENQLLLDHPITRGHDESERINKVVTFTGQALKTADKTAVFLKLGDGAKDKPSRDAETTIPVGGQAQGLAMKVGKGRLVVLGEAAMLSAQLAGPNRNPMGMNAPGNDNRQLALNIVRWLVGALK
jgi:hypothetical protein